VHFLGLKRNLGKVRVSAVLLGEHRVIDVTTKGGFDCAYIRSVAVTTGEWTRDEHDLSMRLFQRTMDKLYKVKE